MRIALINCLRYYIFMSSHLFGFVHLYVLPLLLQVPCYSNFYSVYFQYLIQLLMQLFLPLFLAGYYDMETIITTWICIFFLYLCAINNFCIKVIVFVLTQGFGVFQVDNIICSKNFSLFKYITIPPAPCYSTLFSKAVLHLNVDNRYPCLISGFSENDFVLDNLE